MGSLAKRRQGSDRLELVRRVSAIVVVLISVSAAATSAACRFGYDLTSNAETDAGSIGATLGPTATTATGGASTTAHGTNSTAPTGGAAPAASSEGVTSGQGGS